MPGRSSWPVCPEHSLIDQSLNSRLGATTTNGDGFGIGWYGDQPAPGLFHSIRPAWNDYEAEWCAASVEGSGKQEAATRLDKILESLAFVSCRARQDVALRRIHDALDELAGAGRVPSRRLDLEPGARDLPERLDRSSLGRQSAVLLVAGPWLLQVLLTFTSRLFAGIPDMIG